MVTTVECDVPDRRALHLIDVENLLGGTEREIVERWLGRTLKDFREAADVHPGDLVVIGSNPMLLGEIAAELPAGWLKVAGHGQNGADLALLRKAEPDLVRRRFHRLVVGSGDGIFADLAREVRRNGGEVWVVAVEGHLSQRLRRCASHLEFLREPPSPN